MRGRAGAWSGVVAVAVLASACTPPLALDFAAGWRELPGRAAGSVRVEGSEAGGALRVVAEREQEKKISLRLDAAGLRGARVVAAVRASFHGHDEAGFAAMRLAVVRARGRGEAWDSATSPRVTERPSATWRSRSMFRTTRSRWSSSST